jgi:hypothetical protein
MVLGTGWFVISISVLQGHDQGQGVVLLLLVLL